MLQTLSTDHTYNTDDVGIIKAMALAKFETASRIFAAKPSGGNYIVLKQSMLELQISNQLKTDVDAPNISWAEFESHMIKPLINEH